MSKNSTKSTSLFGDPVPAYDPARATINGWARGPYPVTSPVPWPALSKGQPFASAGAKATDTKGPAGPINPPPTKVP
jgi:hypothetical protein